MSRVILVLTCIQLLLTTTALAQLDPRCRTGDKHLSELILKLQKSWDEVLLKKAAHYNGGGSYPTELETTTMALLKGMEDYRSSKYGSNLKAQIGKDRMIPAFEAQIRSLTPPPNAQFSYANEKEAVRLRLLVEDRKNYIATWGLAENGSYSTDDGSNSK